MRYLLRLACWDGGEGRWEKSNKMSLRNGTAGVGRSLWPAFIQLTKKSWYSYLQFMIPANTTAQCKVYLLCTSEAFSDVSLRRSEHTPMVTISMTTEQLHPLRKETRTGWEPVCRHWLCEFESHGNSSAIKNLRQAHVSNLSSRLRADALHLRSLRWKVESTYCLPTHHLCKLPCNHALSF